MSCSNNYSEVHSANKWEKAELGDDERKKKFLKLMGASKKEHSGIFVIGDSSAEHCRTSKENEELTQNIEDIYRQGLEHKVSGAARRHEGLGFEDHNEEDKNDTKEATFVKAAEEAGDGVVAVDECVDVQDDDHDSDSEDDSNDNDEDVESDHKSSPEKRKLTEKNEDEVSEKKIKFVKSTSD